MSNWTLKESAQVLAAKTVLNYLDKDPDQSIPKLLDWFDHFDVKNAWPSTRG